MTPTPKWLREEAESLRLDPRGLGVYAMRVLAAADAWEAEAVMRRQAWDELHTARKMLAASEQARQRAEQENGWMKRIFLAMPWGFWMEYVEGPWYATGDMDELAFFRALKAENIAIYTPKEETP